MVSIPQRDTYSVYKNTTMKVKSLSNLDSLHSNAEIVVSKSTEDVMNLFELLIITFILVHFIYN